MSEAKTPEQILDEELVAERGRGENQTQQLIDLLEKQTKENAEARRVNLARLLEHKAKRQNLIRQYKAQIASVDAIILNCEKVIKNGDEKLANLNKNLASAKTLLVVEERW